MHRVSSLPVTIGPPPEHQLVTELASLRTLLTKVQQQMEALAPYVARKAALGEGAARLLRERALRAALFPVEVRSEAAWSVLLSLAEAEHTGRRQSVSSAILADPTIAPTTGLRAINALVALRYIERDGDPLDRRRCFLHLSDTAREAMTAFLGAIAIETGPSQR